MAILVERMVIRQGISNQFLRPFVARIISTQAFEYLVPWWFGRAIHGNPWQSIYTNSHHREFDLFGASLGLFHVEFHNLGISQQSNY